MRFATHVDEPVSEQQAADWLAEAEDLGPWLQGPFQLARGVVVEGLWRNDDRWYKLRDRLGDLTGKRVLDIGSNAGYDAFAFKALGAREVVACEPFEFIEQARFLERVFRSGVEFRQIGWQRLDPAVDGTFDLVHCNGVLYHDADPLGMLKRLAELVAPGGEFLLGTMMLEDPEDDDKLRFVEKDYSGDGTWWFVPGREVAAGMLRAAGIDATLDPDLQYGALTGPFGVVNGYLRGPRTAVSPYLQLPPALRPAAPEPAAAPGEEGPPNHFPVGHYYSPMYDARELEAASDRIWPDEPAETPGIDWRADAQVALARDVFARQDRLVLAERATGDETEYFAENDQFPALDAWVLEGLMRHLRPQRMIEVGSGFSTLVAARTNREQLGDATRITCIEPNPRGFLTSGEIVGVENVRVELVQDTPLELFTELSSGDILFIDTSHTVKTGNDVVWLFQEVLPRLAEGVVVHIHDVFVPGEYPKSWVMDGWGWNETYLVRAFLAFNSAFEVLWSNQYMLKSHAEEVFGAFPDRDAYLSRGGASLWLRRTVAG